MLLIFSCHEIGVIQAVTKEDWGLADTLPWRHLFEFKTNIWFACLRYTLDMRSEGLFWPSVRISNHDRQMRRR